MEYSYQERFNHPIENSSNRKYYSKNSSYQGITLGNATGNYSEGNMGLDYFKSIPKTRVGDYV